MYRIASYRLSIAMMLYIVVLILIIQCSNAFTLKTSSLNSKITKKSLLYMSTDIANVHDTLFTKLKEKFVLKETFFADDKGAK